LVFPEQDTHSGDSSLRQAGLPLVEMNMLCPPAYSGVRFTHILTANKKRLKYSLITVYLSLTTFGTAFDNGLPNNE